MEKKSGAIITGMGCISAAGLNLKKNMETLFKGIQNCAPPVLFTTNHSQKYPVFEILHDVQLEHQEVDGIPSRFSLKQESLQQQSNLTRTARLVLIATYQALDDAGLSMNDFYGKRTGVCIGTTVGSTLNSIDFYSCFRKGECPDILPVQRFLESNPAASIAERFNLTGPIQTVANACSSGTDALGIALSWIQNGLCDMVIAGGGDELCRVTCNGFTSLMITDPEPCRPFDARRKGLNLGEAAGIMVLESRESAGQRRSEPRGYICGYGTSCDAHHLVAPDPEGAGLERAIIQALDFSGLKPEKIAFINAHGTGTRDNDRVESIVLNRLFPGTPFFSTKGCTGHTLGAAGAIEAIFTMECLNGKNIPASTGFNKGDTELPGIPVTAPCSIHGNYALSQSLAFGGNNSALVMAGKDKL